MQYIIVDWKKLLCNNNKHKIDLQDLLELSGPPTTGHQSLDATATPSSATSKKIIKIGSCLLHLGPIQA